MVSEGDSAPNFTVPMAGGNGYDDVTDFSLFEEIGDGPVVLAFVPGAFTGGCTTEMCALGEAMGEFDALNASVYGISVDLPFAQNIWMERNGFDVPMLSDWDHKLIYDYDVVYENMYGSIESAERSVFIIDDEGIVRYRWVRDGENPEFDTFVSDLQDRVSNVRSR